MPSRKEKQRVCFFVLNRTNNEIINYTKKQQQQIDVN